MASEAEIAESVDHLQQWLANPHRSGPRIFDIRTVLQALQEAQAMTVLLDRLDAEGWPFWDLGVYRLHGGYTADVEYSGKEGGRASAATGATWREAVQALTAQLAPGDGGEAHG